MAFVVLVSTTSFTVGMHYCGDVLVDTAFFQKADSCGMEMTASDTACEIMKKNCCSDEQLVIEGQNELKISFNDLSIDKQIFLVSFIHTFINGFEELVDKETNFSEYPPPLIVRPIYKLDESYLI
ncbi:MAG: hypothetical protein HKN54_03625 [Flavobacteriaceae bacterium]|nr:hypothetical protein [Flavobacteriaceae bacterium]